MFNYVANLILSQSGPAVSTVPIRTPKERNTEKVPIRTPVLGRAMPLD